MSKKDAMQFPLIGSAVLFGLYLVIKLVKKELLDVLISVRSVLARARTTHPHPHLTTCSPIQVYFALLGAFALFGCVSPPLTQALGVGGMARLERSVHWKFWRAKDDEHASPIEISCSAFDVALFVPCAGASVAYGLTKRWWLNNLLGCAFSVQGIEMLALGSYAIGCILLAGLFLYDVFCACGHTARDSRRHLSHLSHRRASRLHAPAGLPNGRTPPHRSRRRASRCRHARPHGRWCAPRARSLAPPPQGSLAPK